MDIKMFHTIKNRKRFGKRCWPNPSAPLRTVGSSRIIQTGGAGRVFPTTCRRASPGDQTPKYILGLTTLSIEVSVKIIPLTVFAENSWKFQTPFSCSTKKKVMDLLSFCQNPMLLLEEELKDFWLQLRINRKQKLNFWKIIKK